MAITKNIHNFFLLLTYLLGCFPILTFVMRSVITILWSVLGIFIFFQEHRDRKLKKDIWIFILPFLTLVFSLSYSKNIQGGIDSLIKMISLLIYPLIIYLNRGFFTRKQISKIIYFFVISVLALIIYQFIQVVLHYSFITDNITLQEIKSNGFSTLSKISEEKISQIKLRRFRNFIIQISNTHTTYQGLWIGFSVFFVGSQLNKIQKKGLKILNVILIIVLALWLYFISARMPLLALLTSILVTAIFFSNFSRTKLLKLGFFFFGVLIIALSFNNPFSIRVKEYYNTGLTLLESDSKASEFNSSNVRNGIYYCDLKLIEKAPFLGVGIGDIQEELNRCYSAEIGAKVYTWHQYNTHNQYAFFWISSGLLGLVSFFYLIFFLFKKAIKNNNYLLFYFTCLTTIIFFTENLLERSDGVIFFSFFSVLLFFNQKKL